MNLRRRPPHMWMECERCLAGRPPEGHDFDGQANTAGQAREQKMNGTARFLNSQGYTTGSAQEDCPRFVRADDERRKTP